MINKGYNLYLNVLNMEGVLSYYIISFPIKGPVWENSFYDDLIFQKKCGNLMQLFDNHLTPGIDLKVIHTYLFKYVWSLCKHQALKGYVWSLSHQASKFFWVEQRIFAA